MSFCIAAPLSSIKYRNKAEKKNLAKKNFLKNISQNISKIFKRGGVTRSSAAPHQRAIKVFELNLN